MIDLPKVREGDRLLDRAEALHEDEKPKRPVPLTEIIMSAQQTYSVADVADLTGYSEETIRRKIRSGDLPAVGGGEDRAPYRISRVELAKWWREAGGGELFEADD